MILLNIYYFSSIFINILSNKIDFNKKISKMNKNMSLNNRLECNALIKADYIRNDETNKILTKNKIMNDSEGNFKSSKKNKNFLRKQDIKENNNYENKCLPDYFFKNNIFQYYYSTIEYMKKYYNFYMNRDYNNSISKNNNYLNKKNYNICENNINSISSYSKTSNINENNNMKNTIFINNYEDKKINFIFNKNVNLKNKTSESFNNLSNKDTKKINAFSKEIVSNNNLNSNNNEFKNLIININCPSFKPCNFKNNENNSNNYIKSESNIFSNQVENVSKGKENDLEKEEEYSIKMFGKKGWICVLCNNFNFETRAKCNRCKASKNPKKIVNTKCKIKNKNNQNNDDENNDWICSKCQNLNYSFRTICNRCKAPKIYQFVIKPFLYQNIIYNNIIRYSPKLTPSYAIFNNTPNIYLNKIV